MCFDLSEIQDEGFWHKANPSAGIKQLMKTLQRLAVVLLSSFCAASADVVILEHGQVFNGTVLQNNEKEVLVKMDYGTLTFPRSVVKDVRVDNKPSILVEAEVEKRIPAWGQIIEKLAKKSWAVPLKQIPATVIDTGVLRNVPYVSFQGADGYEVNIYGDLDSPAGVEIGLQHRLVNFGPGKKYCIDFLTDVLPNKTDKEVMQKLDLQRSEVTASGLKFEVTPPTAEDAYGGWWVSVYNQEMLEKARASDSELRDITQLNTISPPKPAPKPQVYVQAPTPSTPSSSANTQYTWSSADLAAAHPARHYSGGYSGGGGGGPVYVRGYTRRDGTYVSSYTRRSPRHR